MVKKYIVELESGTHIFVLGPEGITHIGEPDVVYETVDGMQIGDAVINAKPYTEPDLERVRKEGYEDGYKTAKVQCNIQAEKDMREVGKKHYQKGLDDLWEAMQKAIKMYCEIDNEVFLRVFHDVKCDWGESVLQALFKNTPQHLIDSIRKYEQKKQESITAEDVMRQYLDTFCEGQSSCEKCPLNTEEFTCGRGFGFINHNIRERVTDEEVRRAYSTVLAKMKEWQDE